MKLVTPVEQFWHKVPGGTAQATYKTLEQLINMNYEVYGIAAKHKSNQTSFNLNNLELAFSALPRPLLYESWLYFDKPKVTSLVGEHDVVWASSMIIPPTNKPVVTTVHDLDFLVHPENLSFRGKNFFPRLWKKILKTSDLVVCPSKYVADQCVSFGLDQTIVRVVPWGVSQSKQVDKNEMPAEIIELLPDRYGLWVGTLEPRKNLNHLLKAVEQLENFKLVLVGPDGWGSAIEESLVERLKSKVIFLGNVDRKVLNYLYQNSDLFVFPSKSEGFGLPLLEAMANGAPVITSKGSATEEVVADAGILVDPLDAEEIADAINKVFNDPTLASDLSNKGLERSKKYSWKNTAEKYDQVFRSLLP